MVMQVDGKCGSRATGCRIFLRCVVGEEAGTDLNRAIALWRFTKRESKDAKLRAQGSLSDDHVEVAGLDLVDFFGGLYRHQQLQRATAGDLRI